MFKTWLGVKWFSFFYPWLGISPSTNITVRYPVYLYHPLYLFTFWNNETIDAEIEKPVAPKNCLCRQESFPTLTLFTL